MSGPGTRYEVMYRAPDSTWQRSPRPHESDLSNEEALLSLGRRISGPTWRGYRAKVVEPASVGLDRPGTALVFGDGGICDGETVAWVESERPVRDADECAAVLAINPATFRRYVQQGYAPQPDGERMGRFGRMVATWSAEVFDPWAATWNRVGRRKETV